MDSHSSEQKTPHSSASHGLSASVERHLRTYFAAHERGLPSAGLYARILQEIERPLFRVTLAECRGNQLRAAELLGLNRNTLRKKLRELGIVSGRCRRAAEKESR
jgi:two-component system nitrogen regulation response regulator GlnG